MLLLVGSVLVGCAGSAMGDEQHTLAPMDAKLYRALKSADLHLEADGVPADAVVVLVPGTIDDQALPVTWSSCFDAPDPERLVFDADSVSLDDDVQFALGLLITD